MAFDPKAELHGYLRAGRDVMLWKLDGLSEYDMRRPLVPSSTNLLGLVRHVGSIETGYFHRVLIHVIADVQRHAGHADLVRELIDGAIGAHRRGSNLPTDDDSWWADYREEVEAAATRAGRAS